jgi:hypothetical protein
MPARGAEVHGDGRNRDADRKQPEKGRRHAPIAFDCLVIFDLGSRRVASGDRILRELPHERLNDDLGIETDFERVRSDEAPAEDAAGKARDIVSLERLERHHGDFRGV